MHISKFMVSALLLIVTGLHATAQTETLDKQKWIAANLYFKQDAVDFITTAYKDFTPLVTKRKTETGIYKRTVKLKGCELIIETESRVQESAWKADHEYEKNIVVIELDKVMLEGNDLKPSSATNANGLFAGSSFEHSHKVPSYSILTAIVNKDDTKFARLHYEDHLQWAYQFLIDQCSKH
ncbi:MAG: hypothetical protein ACHQD8_03085 [Chitinophagales bacterium]